MKDWDELTTQEKIAGFPDRHPYPFRAMLYLAIFMCDARHGLPIHRCTGSR
jgi:hypothetical protein